MHSEQERQLVVQSQKSHLSFRKGAGRSVKP